jgi:uncharacterized Zn-finger protein
MLVQVVFSLEGMIADLAGEEQVLSMGSLMLLSVFTCERCDKEYTTKSILTRHQKTHAYSSQTYSCGICGKEFNRPDHRKKHEATHGQHLLLNPECQ